MSIKFSTMVYFFLVSAVIGVGISYSKVYLFHIALVFLACSYVNIHLNGFTIKIKKLPTKEHLIFYFMFAWYFLSLMWSWNAIYTLQYLAYIIFGISIVITIIYYSSDLQKQKKLFYVLSVIFITEIILCLLEGLTPIRWPLSPFSPYVTLFGRKMGVDDDLAADVLMMVMRGPTGFQWNPNNMCTVMNIICPFFLFHKNKYLKTIGALSVLIIILLAASRTNLMAFLVMMIFYCFCFSRARALKSVVWFIPITLLFMISFTTLERYAGEDAKINRLFHMFDAAKIYFSGEITGTDSIGTRQQLIKNGIAALISTYGLGVGGGASATVQEKAGGFIDTTSMHNFWVEILVDGGVVFAALFFLWYVKITYKLYSIFLNTRDCTLRYFAASCSLSMAVFTIGAISCSSVIYDLPIWILFGFSIATLNNYKRHICESSVAVGPK